MFVSDLSQKGNTVVIGTMHTSYGFKRTSLETVETANNCLHGHIEKNGNYFFMELIYK